MIQAIYVETSSRCNLHCCYCYRSSRDYASKDRLMPLALFEKLVADLAAERQRLLGDSRPDIFLHGYGEPTLNPQLDRMVDVAAQSGLFHDIRFVSNLQARPPQAYHKYFQAGLTGLYVSLDSLKQEHVARTRRGTDVARLLDALATLAADYADRIWLISVLTPTNKDELPAVGEFLRRHGIATWNIQLLNTRKGRFGLDKDEVSRIKAGLVAAFPELTINFEEESLLACRQPFTTLTVNAAGYLTPCCSLTDHEVVHFGNLAEAGLGALYEGGAFSAFRELFDRKCPPACAGCPYYLPTEGRKS